VNSLRNLDLKKYIPTGERLYTLLAVFAIIVMAFGYLLFARSAILPRLQARSQLLSQLASAQQKLVESRKAQEKTPDNLKQQLAAAQAALNESSQVFLSDSQAADALNRLYKYASDSGVKIVNLQAQPNPAKGSSAYDIRTFRLQVEGLSFNLIRFVTQIKEASSPGYVLSNVNIAEGQTTSALTMDVALYTSPYASAAGPFPAVTPTVQFVTPTPASATPMPTATLTADQLLAQQLDAAWTSSNWPQAISLIGQILALNPTADGMTQKLYAAHVNYGRALAAAGRLEDAKTEFSTALTINPNGAEAMDELLKLSGETPVLPTATPGSQTLYVVQAGDNLYRIALRFGVTVRAVMVANNLTSTNIRPGQQLYIPPR
jgi:LysM repeat protein